MGYAAKRIQAVQAAQWSPLDDRWYMPALGLTTTDAGIAISAETVFLCDVVKAAVQFKADAVALCPPSTYRRKGEDRLPVDDHYSQITLRNPNLRHTSFEWTHLNVTWLSIFGNSYNRIIAGERSFADVLDPIHPCRVRKLRERSDGGLVYEIQKKGGAEWEWVQQEEVLHYRGISMDGYQGMEIYQLIRNAVGISMAAEKHASVFLRKGTRISGVLSTEKDFTDDVKKRARESWQAAFGGVEATHAGSVAVLGDGLKFTPMVTNHREAQFIELQNHVVEKILRHLGVPGIVVGYQGDKASTYASADAFFEKGGLKHCILPLVTSMEQRDDKVLLLGQPGMFTRRNMGVLERADTKSSFEMLVKAAGGPIISRNEARVKLDMNRDVDPDMDKVLQPVNMSAGAPSTEAPVPTDPEPPRVPAPPAEEARIVPAAPLAVVRDNDEMLAAAARLRRQMEKDAARTVRRVKSALADNFPRYKRNPDAWAKFVKEYMAAHAAHVMQSLDGLAEAAAHEHCRELESAVLAGGVGAMDGWERDIAPRLAAMALEEARA